MGGHTVGMLAGMRVTNPHDGSQVNIAEPRIKAGVLIVGDASWEDAQKALQADANPKAQIVCKLSY